MLVGHLNGTRIIARGAQPSKDYKCPGCEARVVLKNGRIVIAHFAHYPNTPYCSYSAGETLEHLNAKDYFYEQLNKVIGIEADIEVPIHDPSGNRRVDVGVQLPSRTIKFPDGRQRTVPGEQIAVEIQHTNISIEEIERRALHYAHLGITQLWISLRNHLDFRHGGFRPFEDYIYKFMLGEIWLCSPGNTDRQTCLYRKRANHPLEGPYQLNQLKFKIYDRRKYETRRARLPACRFATLAVA